MLPSESDLHMIRPQVTYGKPEQFPIVLLASHDGGGSDWLAKILEVISGYYCGIDDNQKQVCIRP